MDQVNSAIASNLAIVAGILALVCLLVVVLVVTVVVQARRIGRLKTRLDGVTRGVDGRSLESVLDSHLETVFRVARQQDALSARATDLETAAGRHLDRVGLVRFNPFEDTGGNQSFALALLDDALDGFVMSSLHSRTGTRIYAKAITGGAADATLSAEEAQALAMARRQSASRAVAAASDGPGGRSRAGTARPAATQVSSTSRPLEPVDRSDEPVDADFLDRRLRGQDVGN